MIPKRYVIGWILATALSAGGTCLAWEEVQTLLGPPRPNTESVRPVTFRLPKPPRMSSLIANLPQPPASPPAFSGPAVSDPGIFDGGRPGTTPGSLFGPPPGEDAPAAPLPSAPTIPQAAPTPPPDVSDLLPPPRSIGRSSSANPADLPLPVGVGITLSELKAIALSGNPTLVQAAMHVEAARGKRQQAGLYPNPTIGWEADEMGINGSAGQQGIFIGQEIVTAGKLHARQAVIAQEIRQAEHTWMAQQARVLCDVRQAWHEVLTAQRILDIHEQLVGISRKAVEAADKLQSEKSVDAIDLWQARVEAESADLRRSEANDRYRAAWRRLTTVLGTPQMARQPLLGDIEADQPELTFDASLARLLAESPELAAAQSSVCRAWAAVERECAERIPNVNVRAGLRYHDETDDTIAGLEVGIPLPIYNRNQGNLRAAHAELVAAQKEVQRVELLLQRRLATAFEQYTVSRRRVARYKAEILPGAQRSLDEVLRGYPQMKYDYLTLLTTQRTYCRVHVAYLDSLLAYRSSDALIDGLLLSGGLDAPPSIERQ